MDPMVEESKAPIEDEFVESEGEEQEKKEYDQEKSSSTVNFTGAMPKKVKAVIVCTPGNAQALTRILFDEKLVEIGKGETTYREKIFNTIHIYYVESH